MIKDGGVVEEGGWLGVVVEKIGGGVGRGVGEEVSIGVMGMGGGGGVEGEVLVVTEMVGMRKGLRGGLVGGYGEVNRVMRDAMGDYVGEVKGCELGKE